MLNGTGPAGLNCRFFSRDNLWLQASTSGRARKSIIHKGVAMAPWGGRYG